MLQRASSEWWIIFFHSLGWMALALSASPLSAQTPTQASFDVASVKQVPGYQDGEPFPRREIKVLPDRLEVRNAPLRDLVLLAYGLPTYRVIWPSRFKSDIHDPRFDIIATFPERARKSVPSMLQSLLAERLGLRARFDERSVPVYALKVQPSGHKMRPVTPLDELDKEINLDASDRPITDATTTPFVAEALVSDLKMRTVVSLNKIIVISPTSYYESRLFPAKKTRIIDAKRLSMAEFVAVLEANRPIVDQTGLDGLYEFSLELPLSLSADRVAERMGMTNRSGNAIERNPQTVTTDKGVETLGLKLVPTQSPVRVLVIDDIRQAPTPN